MNIIRIEKCDSKESYHQWKSDANAKLGLSPDDYQYGGLGPWDFVWIDGRLFKRDSDQQFFYCQDWKSHNSSESGHYPDIVCRCESNQFTAAFGSYRLFLKCVKCGTEEEVYSG